MKRAEYPERSCREPVAAEYLMYSCELAELHPGPCASYSCKASVTAREAWERSEAARAAKQAVAAAKGRTARSGRRRADG